VTEEEAQNLREQRAAEHPDATWIVEQRGGDWVVVRLPAGLAPARAMDARKGEPLEVGDDPRPWNMRNIPPYGGA
jgi:hypothetical protein